LHDQGLVEAEHLAHICQCLGSGSLPKEGNSRVAGQNTHGKEDERQRTDRGRNRDEDALDNVS
jgi:hypothetical protein